MTTSFRKSEGGFTLAELLISMAIFSLLASTMFVGFRGTDRIEKFRIDANLLASNVRKVQNRALSGIGFSDGSFPRGGYGIHMQICTTPPCSYVLFAEQDSPPNQQYTPSTDGVFQTVPFTGETRVVELRVMDSDGTNEGAVTTVDISFKPPRPTPFVWWTGGLIAPPPDPGAGTEGKRVQIMLQYGDDTAITRTIEIKGISGQISEYAN